MSLLKSDRINGAFSEIRISGITVNPKGSDLARALERLENMCAEFEARTICIGYNFEDDPDANSASGIERKYYTAIDTALALRLLPDYGKDATPALIALASGSMSAMVGASAQTRQVEYPRRMPVGSGNDIRYNRYQRFYRSSGQAPISCKTEKMFKDDIRDLTEHFDSFLRDSETISSYTLVADQGLTIQSQSLSSPDVNYRVKAVGTTTGNDRLLQVKIVATSSTGRVETRVIDFQVIEVKVGE